MCTTYTAFTAVAADRHRAGLPNQPLVAGRPTWILGVLFALSL